MTTSTVVSTTDVTFRDQLASDMHDTPDKNVDLDEITYASLYALTAASRSGGLVRGNLATLIRYWTRGAGAAKVGWGRGGDFNRCVRLLARYVPPNQVQGFCARLHKRATGSWPGPGRDRAH